MVTLNRNTASIANREGNARRVSSNGVLQQIINVLLFTVLEKIQVEKRKRPTMREFPVL